MGAALGGHGNPDQTGVIRPVDHVLVDCRWLPGGFPDNEMPVDELVPGTVRPERGAFGMVDHGFLFKLPRDFRDGVTRNRQAGMN